MKKLLIGCGIAAAICFLIAAIVVIRFGPSVFQFAKKSYSEEKEKREFIARWQPPADGNPARLFPSKVESRPRDAYSQETIEMFHTNQRGYHASYGGPSAVEVVVWKGGDQERQRVCNEMNATYEKTSGTRSWLNFEYRCYLKLNGSRCISGGSKAGCFFSAARIPET